MKKGSSTREFKWKTKECICKFCILLQGKEIRRLGLPREAFTKRGLQINIKSDFYSSFQNPSLEIKPLAKKAYLGVVSIFSFIIIFALQGVYVLTGSHSWALWMRISICLLGTKFNPSQPLDFVSLFISYLWQPSSIQHISSFHFSLSVSVQFLNCSTLPSPNCFGRLHIFLFFVVQSSGRGTTGKRRLMFL